MTQFSITPKQGEVSTRVEAALLPSGPYPAIINRIVGIGTTEKHYQGKEPKMVYEVWVNFELPTVQQQFNEKDGLQPRWLSSTWTMSYYGQSKLGGFVASVLGRGLTEEEVNSYDLGNLLGKVVMADVSQNAGKGPNAHKIYNNINTARLVTDQVKAMYNVEWDKIVPAKGIIGLAVDETGDCFKQESFASLPDWIKTKMLNSVEGKEYVNSGGQVYKAPERQPEASAPVAPSAPASPSPQAVPVSPQQATVASPQQPTAPLPPSDFPDPDNFLNQ